MLEAEGAVSMQYSILASEVGRWRPGYFPSSNIVTSLGSPSSAIPSRDAVPGSSSGISCYSTGADGEFSDLSTCVSVSGLGDRFTTASVTSLMLMEGSPSLTARH